MATTDIDALCYFIADCCGTAMMGWFASSIDDLLDIECADGRARFRKTGEMGKALTHLEA